jgi:peptidoglycan hydrolase-like protein with peptidoglycan-binding domain
LNVTVDGIMGPETKAALDSFNTDREKADSGVPMGN